jgi:hypothetical protein
MAREELISPNAAMAAAIKKSKQKTERGRNPMNLLVPLFAMEILYALTGRF